MVSGGRLAALGLVGIGLLRPTNALADFEPGRAKWGKEFIKVS